MSDKPSILGAIQEMAKDRDEAAMNGRLLCSTDGVPPAIWLAEAVTIQECLTKIVAGVKELLQAADLAPSFDHGEGWQEAWGEITEALPTIEQLAEALKEG